MKVRIETDKDTLKKALLSYGETELAAKVDALTDEQIKTIGEYAARHIGQNKLVAKTIALGAIDYFEGKSRSLKKNRRDLSFYEGNDSKKPEPPKNKWWTKILGRKSKN
jgi:hypothetical protein